jgi:hypothetical protein
VAKKMAIYDTLITTFTQTYDSLGRLSEKSQKRLTSKYLYNKDNRNCSSVKVYNINNMLLQATSFDYDIYGTCIKEITTWYDGDSTSESHMEYKFEKSRVVYIKNSRTGEYFIFYDDIGSVVKEKYPNGDIYENKIIYDNLMNEKKVIRYKNGKRFVCYEYNYQYFE